MESEECRCNNSLLMAIRNQCLKCVLNILSQCQNSPEIKNRILKEESEYQKNNFLHVAASKGNPEILGKLLASDLNINVHQRNFMGNTPLTNAAFSGNVDCIKLLVSAGSNIHNVSCYGVSVLHAAFFSSNTKAMKYLIDLGADTNIDVDNPYFKGYIGVSKDHESCKKFLLEYNKA